MNQSSSVIDTYRTRARLFLVLSASAGFTAAACSSSTGPSPKPELLLQGRYALTAKDGSSPRFTNIWFGKDARYEGVRASCTDDCLESGTFVYASGEVTLTAEDGLTAKMRIRPADRAPSVSTSSLRPRSDDPAGSDTAAGGGDADDPCASGVSTASLSPRADDDNGGSLLAGGVTCLLPGRLMAFAVEGDDPKEAATAKLAGNLPSSETAEGEPAKTKGSKDVYGCWWPTHWKCWQENVGFKCEGGGDCNNLTRDICRKFKDQGCYVREIYKKKCGCVL